MRIAYLLESTDVSGGVKVALLQAEALARRGHRVSVVSPDAAPSWFSLSRARFERSSFRESTELASADVRVATFWTTARPAVEGARGPVFHLCQGYEGSFRFYAALRESIEASYRLPTIKLAVSETLATRLEALGLGPVANVGQAFDPTGFFPSESAEPRGDPTILLVGPFAAEVKGIDVALAGLSLWRQTGARFRVRRVSMEAPSPEESSSGLIDEYDREVPPDRMPWVYRASDVFLGPLRPEEGFGLPTLEALASGLACLLSDTPGNREIAGETAIYFRDGDPESLARALPGVTSPDSRRRARENGPRIAARFDPSAVAERLERAFESASSRAS